MMTPILVTSQLVETFKLLHGNIRPAMNSDTNIYVPAIQIITIIITSTLTPTYQIHAPPYYSNSQRPTQRYHPKVNLLPPCPCPCEFPGWGPAPPNLIPIAGSHVVGMIPPKGGLICATGVALVATGAEIS